MSGVAQRLARLTDAVFDRLRHRSAFTLSEGGAVDGDFDSLRGHKYAVLVNFRRNGDAVPLPAWIAVERARHFRHGLYAHVQLRTLRSMATMSASEARAALPEILDRVLAGEEVTITRHGEPVAVVVRPDALRVRRADAALSAAQRLRDMLEKGRTNRLPKRPTLTTARAEELIEDVRASRARR